MLIVFASTPVWTQQPEAPVAWSIDEGSSLVAVVTHKEGLASGLAHEHLVAAPLGAMDFPLDPSKPESTALQFEFQATDLLVDDPDLQSTWQQDLLDGGLLAAPFADLSPKDRRKIRRSMLGPKQLAVEQHPLIRATVDQVRRNGAEASARLAFEVRGRTVERTVQLPWPQIEGEELRLGFSERFLFTEFGIKPYSALLGAIRVADEFDVVVRLVFTSDQR